MPIYNGKLGQNPTKLSMWDFSFKRENLSSLFTLWLIFVGEMKG